MAEPFSVAFLVRDHELDQYGVVNNAVYQNYLEHARHEFLHHVGMDPAAVARSGAALALSEIHLKYMSPLRSRESFRVDVAVAEMRPARVVFQQDIHETGTGRPVLKARAVAVFLNAQGRPTRVSPEIQAMFAPYLAE